MTKNLMTKLLCGLLSATLLLPLGNLPMTVTTAYADETEQVIADTADDSTESAADTSDDSTESAADSSDDSTESAADSSDDNPESVADTQVDDSQIAEAYRELDINALLESGKLALSGEVSSDFKYAYDENAEGLVISGTVADFKTATFTFADEFDFSEGAVERILTDALATRGTNTKLEVYLDDETEPAVSITVNTQKREGVWSTKNLTVQLEKGNRLTGKHKVSIKFAPKGDDTDKVNVKINKLTFVKSTVPTLYFNIDESLGSIKDMNSDDDHNTECYGDVDISVPENYDAEYTDEELSDIKGLKLSYIRGRGNSTWRADKKPYKLKLAKSTSLLGMSADKDWVLIADYYDPSHIRNKITYWMGAQMNFGYTTKCVYVDVVMNGEYYGSYLLSEQIKVDENRLNIDNLENDTDMDTTAAENQLKLTGGYYLGMQPYFDEVEKHFQIGDETYLIESPSFGEYDSEEQYQPYYDYIVGAMQKADEAVKTLDYDTFSQYLDMDSTIDYYWIQEFSANGDAFQNTSSHLYKERDTEDAVGKFYWGPIWDFDAVAWGNNEYDKEAEFDIDGLTKCEYSFYQDLFKNEEFVAQVQKRYYEFKDIILEAAKDGGQIDAYADQIRYSMYYNDLVYGNNYESSYNDKQFSDSVAQLKNWINDRIEGVERSLDSMQMKQYRITFTVDGKTISTQTVYQGEKPKIPEVTAPEGKVLAGWYYTDEYGEYQSFKTNQIISSDLELTAVFADPSELPEVKQIVLGRDSQTIVYSENYDQYELDYAILGGSDDETLTWTSSDESVVTVNENGIYTIMGMGKATITAKASNGVSASCVITVADQDNENDYIPYSGNAWISDTSLTLKPDETAVLSVQTEEESVDSLKVEWFAIDNATGGLSVNPVGSKCTVTGLKEGTYTLCAKFETSDDFVYNVCKVTVQSSESKKDTTPETSTVLLPGDTFSQNGLKYRVMSITSKSGTLHVYGCTNKNAKTLSVPATVKKNGKTYKVVAVSNNAFKGMAKLTSVTLGTNVTKIGQNAFRNCKKLWNVTIKSKKLTKKTIGKNAFTGTKVLLAGDTFTASGLKYKVMSVSTKTGTLHVYGCTNKNVKTLKIPATVKKYGKTYKVVAVSNNAFKGMAKLTSVTLGTNVTKIGQNAFLNCKKLSKVTIKSKKLTKKNIGKNAFKGTKVK